MSNLPDLSAGVYEHFKGKRYLVLGPGHDANADTLFDWDENFGTLISDIKPLGERLVVVYVPLYDEPGHIGPRMAVRTWTDFTARLHLGNTTLPLADGTICAGSCRYSQLNSDGVNNHLTVHRFTYIGPG